jgi:predicted lipid-binding transport protein (Tim44 family)
MKDFASFKQQRLRQDPTAGKYSDYEWERAYKAYLSARGHAPEEANEKSSNRGHRRAVRTKSRAPSTMVFNAVPASFRTAAVVAWVGGFFVAVFVGWFISSMGGGAAGLIGFLAGCALLTFFSALIGLLFSLMSQQLQLHQSLEALSAELRSDSTGKRPINESES